MSNDSQQIVNKAWNFAHVLRDDGLSYTAFTVLPDFVRASSSQACEGKLVPQDPQNDPASVLLERIKSVRDGRMNGDTLTQTRRGRRLSKSENLEE